MNLPQCCVTRYTYLTDEGGGDTLAWEAEYHRGNGNHSRPPLALVPQPGALILLGSIFLTVGVSQTAADMREKLNQQKEVYYKKMKYVSLFPPLSP